MRPQGRVKSSVIGAEPVSDYFSAAFVEHMTNPRQLAPVGGPAWKPSGVGTMEGPRLKTQIRVWVSISETEPGKILDLVWRVYGVPESVPAASVASEYILERGIDATHAAALTVEEVSGLLDGIPWGREPAALWFLQALRRALAATNSQISADVDTGDHASACHCMGVTFADLRVAAKTDNDRLNLQRRTGFGTGCGTCLYVISEFLDEIAPTQ